MLQSDVRSASRRARRWAGALLLAGAAAAPLFAREAFADDAAQRVQAAIDAIRAGDVAAAVTRLDEAPATEVLAARADLVHVLCDRAYRYDRALPDPAPRRTLAARLHGLAEAAVRAAPGDDRARWALAEALVLRERSGPAGGPAAWTQAADLLEKIHEAKPKDALPLAYAASFLLEGACSDEDSAVPFSNRADALARKALAAQADSPTLAVTVANAQLWCARTILAKNKKVARSQVKACLDSLEPFASGEPPVLEAATLWNEALGFARRSGFVLQERFVLQSRATLDGALEFDVPVSSRWSFHHVDAAGDVPAFDYVTETAADGARVRQVLFRRYLWSQRYTFEGTNPVGGDNVKSLAQGLQEMVAARVLGGAGTTPSPARKPFNRSMDGFVFETAGRLPGDAASPSGSPLRVTGYVMRGHNQACFAVLVYDYTGEDGTTPEVETLLASLREPSR